MSTGQRPKILYFITKSNWGGAQKYVYDLATEMGPEVVVVLGGDGELKTKLESVGVKTISLARLGRDIKLWSEFLVLIKFWKIIRAEKPNIVHLNSPKAGGLGALVARLAGVPKIIYTAHGWPFAEERPTWQKLAIKFFSWLTIALCHQVIVIAESEYQKVASWPLARRKLHLIYNGIKDLDFLPREIARARLSLDPDKFIIGTIAELHKNKGLEYLKTALTNWQGESLTWALIGEGELHSQVKSWKANWQGESLTWVGAKDNAAQYLKAFDLFVLPSIKEGLPYVLLEAGLAALPVIATRVGGIPEIIDHEVDGILVNPKDPPALAQAILELQTKSSKSAQFGQKLRAKIQTKFSPHLMLAKTLEIYDN